MKISGKIILPFIIILIVIASSNFFAGSWLINKSLNEEVINNSEIMGRNIAQISAENILNGSTYLLQDTVVTAKDSSEHVVYAIIVDSTGLCLANTDLSVTGEILDKTEFEKDALRIDKPVAREVPDQPLLVEFVVPIFVAEEKIGLLRMGISMLHTQQHTREIRDILLVIELLILFLGILVYLRISKLITNPISRAAALANDIAKGNFNRKLDIDQQDEIGELAASFNKMTEDLKASREEIVSEKNYINNILTSMSDMLMVVSPDGYIQTVNNALCDLLGYEERELIGQPVGKVIEDALNFKSPAFDEARIREFNEEDEKAYITKNGSKIYVLYSGSIMHDDRGNIHGIVCMAQDITNRRRAEEEVRRKKQDLENAYEELQATTVRLAQSNDELKQFAYIASHDLQEPLRKVTAFGDRLKDKYAESLGDQGKDYLERMQSAAGRMQTLINDLLTYSRVTTKAQPFVSVDLASVVNEVFSDLEVRIEQVNGRVDIGALPAIDADPLQMRQLLQNLIGNALKFNKKGEPPVVKVSGMFSNGNGAAAEDDYYQLIVEDNGIGFDEKYADRIFGVFQRLHGRSEYEGTGIGLSVCKKIVERHNGSIAVKSAPGQGAKFIITLPVKQIKGESTNG